MNARCLGCGDQIIFIDNKPQPHKCPPTEYEQILERLDALETKIAFLMGAFKGFEFAKTFKNIKESIDELDGD